MANHDGYSETFASDFKVTPEDYDPEIPETWELADYEDWLEDKHREHEDWFRGDR